MVIHSSDRNLKLTCAKFAHSALQHTFITVYAFVRFTMAVLCCKYSLPHSCWAPLRVTKELMTTFVLQNVTPGLVSLSFFPFLLACTQVLTLRLHDLGCISRKIRRKKERKTVNSEYCKTGEKEGEEHKRYCEIKKREAKETVWCGLGGLVLMTTHSGNSRYCDNLLFKNQS